MPKYIFSQGKVWVEEGVYQPLLKRKKQLGDTFVLLFTSKSQTQLSEPSASVEKEQEDVEQQGTT